MKPTYTNDVNESFKEIKDGLKAKYSEMIFSRIDELRKSSLKKLFGAMDEGLTAILNENEELKKTIDLEKKNFYATEDYQNAQNKLVSLKNKLSACNESEKDDLNAQMSKALDRISTLNVTINNRLKKYSDKMQANSEVLAGYIASDDGEFGKVKKDFIDAIDDILQDGIASYNEELEAIKETFGIESDGEIDFPFDENQVRIEIDLLPRSMKNLDAVKPEKEDKSFINIENDSNIKN